MFRHQVTRVRESDDQKLKSWIGYNLFAIALVVEDWLTEKICDARFELQLWVYNEQHFPFL